MQKKPATAVKVYDTIEITVSKAVPIKREVIYYQTDDDEFANENNFSNDSDFRPLDGNLLLLSTGKFHADFPQRVVGTVCDRHFIANGPIPFDGVHPLDEYPQRAFFHPDVFFISDFPAFYRKVR